MQNFKLKNDELKLFFLLVLTIIVVYYLPFIVNQIYFFCIMIYMVYTKKYHYFWIAFWFIIIDCPGHLFAGGDGSDLKQLPFISISGTARIDFLRFLPLIFLK